MLSYTYIYVRGRHPDVTVRLEHGEQERWPEPGREGPTGAQCSKPGDAPEAAPSTPSEPWRR